VIPEQASLRRRSKVFSSVSRRSTAAIGAASG